MTNDEPGASSFASEAGDEHSPRDGGSSSLHPGTPRWVKILGAIVIALILLLVIVNVIGGGNHGPAMHTPTGDGDGHAPPVAHGADHP